MNDRLTKLLATIFDMKISDINESLTKEDIYKWDSLVQMELVTMIENEFNIQLTMDDIIEMNSVKNIIAILEKYEVFINATV